MHAEVNDQKKIKKIKNAKHSRFDIIRNEKN